MLSHIKKIPSNTTASISKHWWKSTNRDQGLPIVQLPAGMSSTLELHEEKMELPSCWSLYLNWVTMGSVSVSSSAEQGVFVEWRWDKSTRLVKTWKWCFSVWAGELGYLWARAILSGRDSCGKTAVFLLCNWHFYPKSIFCYKYEKALAVFNSDCLCLLQVSELALWMMLSFFSLPNVSP